MCWTLSSKSFKDDFNPSSELLKQQHICCFSMFLLSPLFFSSKTSNELCKKKQNWQFFQELASVMRLSRAISLSQKKNLWTLLSNLKILYLAFFLFFAVQRTVPAIRWKAKENKLGYPKRECLFSSCIGPKECLMTKKQEDLAYFLWEPIVFSISPSTKPFAQNLMILNRKNTSCTRNWKWNREKKKRMKK